MRTINLLSAVVITIVASVIATEGQTVSMSLIPAGREDVTIVRFPAPADAAFDIKEAIIPARNNAECFAATDFSSAEPVGPDRVSMIYDPALARWFLKNANTAGSVASCRVLLVRSTAGGVSFIVHRSRYGTIVDDDHLGSKEESIEAASAQRSMVTSIQVTFDGTSTL